jgi:hypothetical protein
MKKFMILMLLAVIIGNIGAVDTESYLFIDHLLRLSNPGAPEIFEDGVIFTAPSTYRRVGIAFAHEGFSKVYWFRKLLIPKEELTEKELKNAKEEDLYRDSGILFHVYTVPLSVREVEYRLVIDGLWTADPLNPLSRVDQQSGILRSTVIMPGRKQAPSTLDGPPGSLRFSYQAEPGAYITVAGSFNGWDPFMYELKEVSPGSYGLTLPLRPGTYQYVFFHRGERILDPNNFSRVYTKDGKVASEAVVQ